MAKFELGERVVILADIFGLFSTKVPEGEAGTVREVNSGLFSNSYRVKFDNGEDEHLSESDLRPG